MKSGITCKTPERYIIGPGEVRLNYVNAGNPGVLLGATLGGNQFVVEPEYRDPRPDGARGKLKGFRTLNDISVQLVVNMFEITRETLLKALPGATGAVDGDHFVITPGMEIADGDYLTNVAIIGDISGSDDGIICIVKNALVDGGLSLSLVDRDDTIQEMTFSGHFACDAIDEIPYEIRYPSEITT